MPTGYYPRESAISRYSKRVYKNIKNGCWEWTGCLTKAGYGKLSINDKEYYVHRLSYEWNIGKIPEGMEICHKCDNPKCSNPDHLFLGTHKENINDAKKKGRTAFGERGGQSKFTDKKVSEILSDPRMKYPKGKNQIAKENKVCIGTIRYLSRYWKFQKDNKYAI